MINQKIPGITWPVVAQAPIPATIPNIAIKPLKRSAPEFMTKFIKTNNNYGDQFTESGIPNGLILGVS